MNCITVIYKDKFYHIEFEPQNRLSLNTILSNNGFLLNTSCGGTGNCGKCTVYNSDTQATIKACSYYPDKSMTISISESALLRFPDSYDEPHNNKTNHSQTNELTNNVTNASQTNKLTNKLTHESVAYVNPVNSKLEQLNDIYTCAIDIGSTCITVCILKEETIIAENTFFNSTISAGTDIISRMDKACSGSLSLLTSLLRKDITDSIANLLIKHHIKPSILKKITIACNSAMQHLLMKLDCSGMRSYPFHATKLQFKNIPYEKISGTESIYFEYMKSCHAMVTIIPSIGPFIGGDIVSGLYFIDALSINKPFILLDLGTNAEIILGTNNSLLCTSTAAGPAFEASGLSSGIPYVDGAIYDVSVKKNAIGNINVSYKTVSNKLPLGICGSGILTLLSELIRNDIIDNNGTFINPAQTEMLIAKSPTGNIKITQEDIRKLQVAIAAIRTGIDILVKYKELTPADIINIFIAGSFGLALDLKKLSNLRLLPTEWNNPPHTIHYIGNSSLKGAVKSTHNTDAAKYYTKLIENNKQLELSNLPEFNRLFIDNMIF